MITQNFDKCQQNPAKFRLSTSKLLCFVSSFLFQIKKKSFCLEVKVDLVRETGFIKFYFSLVIWQFFSFHYLGLAV